MTTCRRAAAATPVSDFIYTISPTIALNQTTPRQHLTLTYSPGFTFYQHTSALNAANQNAAVNFQYRLSRTHDHQLERLLSKELECIRPALPLSGGAISGSTQSPPTGVVAPFAEQLSNTANVGLSHQFSRNGMIGASGIVTESNYPNPAEASGLYNSNSRRRLGFLQSPLVKHAVHWRDISVFKKSM